MRRPLPSIYARNLEIICYPAHRYAMIQISVLQYRKYLSCVGALWESETYAVSW